MVFLLCSTLLVSLKATQKALCMLQNTENCICDSVKSIVQPYASVRLHLYTTYVYTHRCLCLCVCAYIVVYVWLSPLWRWVRCCFYFVYVSTKPMNAFVRGADAKMILWRSNQCRLIAWLCSLCVRHAKFLLEFKQCLCAPILH